MQRVAGKPTTGFFKIRLVQGGVYVPAVIYQTCPAMPCEYDIDPCEWFMPLDRSRPLKALVNGKEGNLDKVFEYGKEISATEYNQMLTVANWANDYSPNDPLATPYKKVNLTEIPELF